MGKELFYTVFPTDCGWIGILDSVDGLVQTTLPLPSRQEAVSLLDRTNGAVFSPQRNEDLVGRYIAYFKGEKVSFADKLDLDMATDFQRLVWETARQIPGGETRSYGWLAGRIGRPAAARAVGQALGRNQLPIIVPCHRVLAADGSLGGFTGGLEQKKLLLELEQATRLI
jgi:methylated-DNA-[protein]-cysteine S-methyltransferase